MRYIISTCAIVTVAIIFSACSSTQSSYYKPGDSGTGWKVNVTKKGGLPDEFICTINDSTVCKGSFPFIGDNFETRGTYRGKQVIMNGFRTSKETTDSNGNKTTEDKYQIRVFIDDKQVDKFDF